MKGDERRCELLLNAVVAELSDRRDLSSQPRSGDQSGLFVVVANRETKAKFSINWQFIIMAV